MVPAPSRARRRPTHPPIRVLGSVALVLVLLAVGVPGTPVHPAGPAPRVLATGAGRAAEPAAAAGSNATGPFFVNTSSLYSLPRNSQACAEQFGTEEFCYAEETSPSVVPLGGSDVGVAFSVSTRSSLGCPNASEETGERVAFSLSNDGGAAFNSTTLVGGSGTAACPYFQQFEPAFTSDGLGNVVGVYVGANISRDALAGAPYAGSPGAGGIVNGYGERPTDALLFTRSSNDGASFGNFTVLAQGNVARPVIASSGRSIYVAYENISNSTQPLPDLASSGYIGSNSSYGVAVYVIASTDDGASWSGPVRLTGEGPAQFYSAFSPSISVNATGAIAVAYDTDRRCVEFCQPGQGANAVLADSIVLSLSTDNGSTFSLPVVVAPEAVEPGVGGTSVSAGGFYLSYVWEETPPTAVALGPSGEVYVAWASAVNQSATSSPAFSFEDYGDLELFAAASNDLGAIWTVSTVGGPVTGAGSSGTISYFSPALALNGSVVDLSYEEQNSSASGFSDACAVTLSNSTGPTVGADYSSWLVRSESGEPFGPPALLSLQPGTGGIDSGAYFGDPGSIGLGPDGPIVAQTVPTYRLTRSDSSGYTVSYGANISLARVASGGATTNLTLSFAGPTGGGAWEVDYQGSSFSSTGSELTISGIPAGVPGYLTVGLSDAGAGFEEFRVASQPGGVFTFDGPNASISELSVTLVGFSVSAEPADVPYFSLSIDAYNSTTGTAVAEYARTAQTELVAGEPMFSVSGCPFPWYLPLGLNFTLNGPADFPVSADYRDDVPPGGWVGNGNGSYTGPGPEVPVTLDGPINETFSMLADGSNYTLSVAAPTLPTGTRFSFSVNSSGYSASAGSNATVDGLAWGPAVLGNITAGGPSPGEEYFGFVAGGDTVLVPNDPAVNLTFALVNLTEAPAAVSLHAVNVTDGTPWQLELNGTEYSSTSPYLNLTLRPGLYPIEGFPISASSDAGATYAPEGFPSAVWIGGGAPVELDYAEVLSVRSIASTGGGILSTGCSAWESPGASCNLTARALAGFRFLGWSGTGEGSYTGTNFTAPISVEGPILEAASFEPLPPDRFNLTFEETGVPSGETWTVFVNGVGYGSSTDRLVVGEVYSCAISPGPESHYSVSVPDEYDNSSSNRTRFVPVSSSVSACGGTNVSLAFDRQFYLSLTATTGGSVGGSAGDAYLDGPAWIGANETVSLQASNDEGYRFLGWNGTGPGSYTGTDPSPSFPLVGPVGEVAAFGANPAPVGQSYPALFELTSPLAPGTSWSITVDGRGYATTGSEIEVSGLSPGAHPVTVAIVESPNGTARYTPTASDFELDVTGNMTVPVEFTTGYWVDIGSVGPGSVDQALTFYPAGSQIVLEASANPGALFVGWKGTGPGSYTGPDANGIATVDGPITEVASFESLVPPPTAVPPGIFQSPGALLGIGLAGLVAGAASYLALRSSRRSRPDRERSRDRDRYDYPVWEVDS